jgi:hypothetical protein
MNYMEFTTNFWFFPDPCKKCPCSMGTAGGVKCSLAGPERRACCHGDEAACSLIAKMSDRKNLEIYRHT